MNMLERKTADLTSTFSNLDANRLDQFLLTFTHEVQQLEKYYPREMITHAIHPIRHLAAASPFLERAQRWPRGYQGDFQTIEHILNAENKASPGTMAYAIEDFFLHSPICQQHRNKVTAQAALISSVIAGNGAARILSIGCGTSADLYACSEALAASACEVVLVDTDVSALEYSRGRLPELEGRLSVIEGNVYRIAKKIPAHFDLIIIGGVFDYLEDKAIVAITKELRAKLNPDGILFFTNIATGNPYRVSMEYLADWCLIERSSNDIFNLLKSSGAHERYEIEKEDTGLTYLVKVYKK
ncbi:class I SAM-dependent methyltransferase [Chitinophaga niabensis]|nr:class I SAM-dependent methyltransferase [Chitinophaga niabensis]